jgi:hypothetical protein
MLVCIAHLMNRIQKLRLQLQCRTAVERQIGSIACLTFHCFRHALRPSDGFCWVAGAWQSAHEVSQCRCMLCAVCVVVRNAHLMNGIQSKRLQLQRGDSSLDSCTPAQGMLDS